MAQPTKGKYLTEAQNDALRKALASTRLNQTQIGKAVGVSQSNIAKFRASKQGMSLGVALRLCALLKIEPASIGLDFAEPASTYVEPEETNAEIAIAFADARAAGVSPEIIEAARERVAHYRGAEPTRDDAVKALREAMAGEKRMAEDLGLSPAVAADLAKRPRID